MFSFQRLVPTLFVFVVTYGIVSDANLAATIASSFAPIAVVIKLKEERDMDTKSLSKSLISRDLGAVKRPKARKYSRKAETNLSKWSLFCKVLEEEVYSFLRLVPTLFVFVVTYGIVSDVNLGDHIIFSYSRLGAI